MTGDPQDPKQVKPGRYETILQQFNLNGSVLSTAQQWQRSPNEKQQNDANIDKAFEALQTNIPKVFETLQTLQKPRQNITLEEKKACLEDATKALAVCNEHNGIIRNYLVHKRRELSANLIQYWKQNEEKFKASTVSDPTDLKLTKWSNHFVPDIQHKARQSINVDNLKRALPQAEGNLAQDIATYQNDHQLFKSFECYINQLQADCNIMKNDIKRQEMIDKIKSKVKQNSHKVSTKILKRLKSLKAGLSRVKRSAQNQMSAIMIQTSKGNSRGNTPNVPQ